MTEPTAAPVATTDTASLEETKAGDEHVVPCPVCGGTTLDVLLTPEDVQAERDWLRRFLQQAVDDPDHADSRLQFTQEKPTHIVECHGCGTILRDPQPTPEALKKLYQHDTYGPEALRRLAENQDAFFRDKALPFQQHLSEGARVLEIGSFVGSFLLASSDCGWTAEGVDVGHETASFARDRGCKVHLGDVRQVDLPENDWDAVFIWNTFDQISHPGQLLQRVARLLKDGGLLVLRLPNGAFESGCIRLRRQESKPRPRRPERIMRVQAHNSFLTFPYLTGYTPQSVTDLLARHRLRTQSITGNVIVRLADDKTLPEAVQEEHRSKRAVLRLCRHLQQSTGSVFHPWIDVVARKHAA